MTEMQAGDVVLVSRGTGVLDKVVQFATASPYFHAALAINSTEVVEAAFRGVRYNELSTYAGRCSILRVDGATLAQRHQAVEWARQHIGLGYGWHDIFADALRLGLHVPYGYHWRTWHHYDCSCLVANAYALAGVPLTFAPAPSPATLGWSSVLVGTRPWRAS